MNNCKQLFYVELVMVAALIVMVLAVFIGMYASVDPGEWSAEGIFCSIFFGISIPAWICAFWLTGVIRKNVPAPDESIVNLPGYGPRMVRWVVRDAAGPAGRHLSHGPTRAC